jgi:translocation and assembly module TamB
VVVLGRGKKSEGKTVATLDVGISLGKGVTLQGRGLDALLRGEIRLRSGAGESLRAQGTLNVAEGTYTAYGRALTIEQGLLRFTGPINNPVLDITAMRRHQEVDAGVSVRGTALAPRVVLVSEPSVPDAEKLSWLVLGNRLGSAGGTDASDLEAAAGALLSESAASGVQSHLAAAFGVDKLTLSKSQDSLQERIITVDKQISSRLYFSYQQGLQTANSIVRLRYTLGRRFTLETETGTRSVLSLFYNISFD